MRVVRKESARHPDASAGVERREDRARPRDLALRDPGRPEGVTQRGLARVPRREGIRSVFQSPQSDIPKERVVTAA